MATFFACEAAGGKQHLRASISIRFTCQMCARACASVTVWGNSVGLPDEDPAVSLLSFMMCRPAEVLDFLPVYKTSSN